MYTKRMNNSQNGDHPLPVVPAHFLDKFDTSDEVASTAGTKEQTIIFDKVPRHRDRFCIGNPDSVV